MTGIITFPSFHTAVAIITVWVVRGLGGFWPLLVLNIGVCSRSRLLVVII